MLRAGPLGNNTSNSNSNIHSKKKNNRKHNLTTGGLGWSKQPSLSLRAQNNGGFSCEVICRSVVKTCKLATKKVGALILTVNMSTTGKPERLRWRINTNIGVPFWESL